MKKPRKKPLHPYFEALGGEIRKVRTSKGLSLEVLGSEIGLDASNLQKIELGQNLTVSTVLKLCIRLNMSPADLFKKLPWDLQDKDIEALTTPRKIRRKAGVKGKQKKRL
jgi:transcriptional regulator with XRE-family HTH domain